MRKNMNNFISLGLSLAIVLGISLVPVLVQAEGGKNYVYGGGGTDYYDEYAVLERTTNPKPTVRILNPNAGSRGEGHATITVTGMGFVQGSVGKVNGMSRPTTFIDSSRLLVQVNLDEPYQTEDGFFVTVWNPSPGGGTSNGVFFKLEGALPAPVAMNGYGNYGYGYGMGMDSDAGYYGNKNTRNTSLASSVILGGPTFLPSSLVQWVFVGILTLLIIILTRKVLGQREEYDNTPLKHA